MSAQQTQKLIPDFNRLPQKPKWNKYAFSCAILASMTSILLGYDVGVMSGAGPLIKDDLKISDVELEIIMGIINIYSLLGSAAAGRTSDLVGRRYTIVISAVIFFIGALLMGFATNYTFLMVGRFVAGLGVGYALLIAPVYTAELSPASSRGFLTSFPEVFINAGVLLGYVSNYVFSKLPLNLGWRFMLGMGAIPSVFLALGVLTMPESPRWLVLQGRLGDAKRVLDKTSDSKEEAKLRLADIKEAARIPEDCDDNVVRVPKCGHGEGVWKELFVHPTPAVKHILIAGVGVHFFQQCSGIDAVVLYSPKIFEKAGITSKSDKLLATVAVGFEDHIHSCCNISTGSSWAQTVTIKQRWGAIFCCVVLDRARANTMGLQLGDLPIEAAGPRDKHGNGYEPSDERNHIDDFSLSLQGDHNWRGFLSLHGSGDCELGFLLYTAPGNTR
ncbi:hypothetical protein Vadar_003604 [Vaccinium darrowii]|uniref:Uncharacterized protein n=1 Tax=Vaccinium darrowii TaxID=229202 RepID=A0ACB7YBF6_9ERIC|nr:hypothetical protein Vadar_003604 [Vaccinium darrowii]